MRVFKSFFKVSILGILSRILSFLRDILISGFLGANNQSDIFFVVLKFVSNFKSFFAEGPLSAVFVPEYLKRNSSAERQNFSKVTLIYTTSLMIVLVAILFIIAPVILKLLVPGFAKVPGKIEIASYIFRIMIPVMILICISAVLAAVIQANHHAWIIIVLSILINISLIISIIIIRDVIQDSDNVCRNLTIAIIIAYFLQVTIIAFVARRYFNFHFHKNLLNKEKLMEFLVMLRRFVPTVLSGCIDRTSTFVNTFFASNMIGLNSYIYYADKIFHLPVYIIGFAMNCAFLPEISEHIANDRLEEANSIQNRVLEFILVVSAPITILLAVFSEEFVFVLLHRGNFNAENAIATAQVLQIFSLALPALIISQVLVSNFFARRDTKTPMKISLFCILCNIIANLICSKFFNRIEVPIINTCYLWLDCFLLIFFLRKKQFLMIDKKLLGNMNKIIFSIFVSMGSILILEKIFNYFNYNLNWWLVVILSTMLYILMIFIVKIYDFNLLKSNLLIKK